LLTLRAVIRRKLYVIHCPDTFDPATSPLPAMRQGMVFEV